MTRPFRTIAIGFLFVLLNFRLNQYDLLPNALGFGIAAFALASTPPLPLLVWARRTAWVGCAASLPTSLGLVYKAHTTSQVIEATASSQLTTESTTWQLTGLGTALGYVEWLAQLALVLLLCFGIRGLVGAETPFGRRALRVAGLTVGSLVIEFLLVLLSVESSAAPGAMVVAAVLVALVVAVIFLRFLIAADREIASLAEPDPQADAPAR